MTETLKATCHCGAVELAVTPVENWRSTARHCDCSYCRRRAAAVISAPLDGVKIVKGADSLTLYTFGTHTAQHHFCKTCGVYMYHKRRSNPNELGVNLFAIEGMEPKEWEPLDWNDGVNHPTDR